MTQPRWWWLALAGAVLVALLLWWSAGGADAPRPRPAARPALHPTPPPPPEPGEAPSPPPAEQDVLTALGIDRAATPHCAQIWIWTARRVPGWVITDNIEAQAMLFDDRELACLTGTPQPRPEWIPELPGGVLQMAENRPRYPQPPRGP